MTQEQKYGIEDKFLVPALLLAQLWTISAPCLQHWDFDNTWLSGSVSGGKNATAASDNTSLSLWGPKCFKGDWFNASDCGTLGTEKEALARAQVKRKTDFSRSVPGSFYLHPFTSVDLSKFLILSFRVIAVLITWRIGDLRDKEKEKASLWALNIALLLPKPLPPPSPSHILQASTPPNHTHPAIAPSCIHILISQPQSPSASSYFQEHTAYCCFHHTAPQTFPNTVNISCLSLPRHVAYNHHGLPHPHHVDNWISKISTAEIKTHPVSSTLILQGTHRWKWHVSFSHPVCVPTLLLLSSHTIHHRTDSPCLPTGQPWSI